MPRWGDGGLSIFTPSLESIAPYLLSQNHVKQYSSHVYMMYVKLSLDILLYTHVILYMLHWVPPPFKFNTMFPLLWHLAYCFGLLKFQYFLELINYASSQPTSRRDLAWLKVLPRGKMHKKTPRETHIHYIYIYIVYSVCVFWTSMHTYT